MYLVKRAAHLIETWEYAHKEERSGGTVDGSQNLQSTNFTDKNIFDNSYQLVTHFLDFPIWENKIAYFE